MNTLESEITKLKEEIKDLKERLAGRDKIIDNYGVKGRELKEENERLSSAYASEFHTLTSKILRLESINRELLDIAKGIVAFQSGAADDDAWVEISHELCNKAKELIKKAES